VNGDKNNSKIKNMKSMILFLICIFLASASFCLSNTAWNNEQEEFQMVQGAILQYHKNTNKFPTSWDDLWDNPASRPIVESLDKGTHFGKRTDMIESFRFIAPGTAIFLPGGGARVVGMMTRPMRPPPERKLRLLVIQLKDGTRGSKQVPEELLQKMFASAGFDLADYTGTKGNWASETRLRPLSEIAPSPARALSDPSMDYSTLPSRPDKLPKEISNGITNTTAKKATPFPWWVITSFLTVVVMTVVAWLKFRDPKSTP
jgi:hypothetical protein